MLSEAYVEMGFMQFQQEDYDAAVENFKNALEIESFDAQAHMGLSKVAHKRNDTASQMEHALRAFELEPGHSEINNNLGIAYECNGDLDEGEESYLRALELNDMNAAAANNLGHLYEKKMKQYPEQAEHYRESAIEAWKQRLSICVIEERSTLAATTHLLALGMTKKELDPLLQG